MRDSYSTLVFNRCLLGCHNHYENTVTLNGSRSMRSLLCTRQDTTGAVELCHYDTLRLRLQFIHRTFVEPMMSARLFAQVSFDVGERAVSARLLRLIFVKRPIYGHLHPAHRGGDAICFPFCETNSFAIIKTA